MDRKIVAGAFIVDGLWITAQVIFAILWLAGIINWPWYWLLSPLIFALVICSLSLAVLLIARGLTQWRQ